MNPIVAWILAHPRDQWRTAAVRAGYEALHGPITDTEWRSATSMAYRNEAVTDALVAANPLTYLGTVLQGLVSGQGGIVVRVVIHAVDWYGHHISRTVDIGIGRGERMDALNQRIGLAALALVEDSGGTIESTEVLYIVGGL